MYELLQWLLGSYIINRYPEVVPTCAVIIVLITVFFIFYIFSELFFRLFGGRRK